MSDIYGSVATGLLAVIVPGWLALLGFSIMRRI